MRKLNSQLIICAAISILSKTYIILMAIMKLTTNNIRWNRMVMDIN